MPQLQRLDIPLAKAEYLLTRVAEPGQGGDKQNFWQNILGFESAETIREAILKEVSIDILESQGTNAFGERYQAYIQVTGVNEISRSVLTVWIVLFGQETARFVTAVPDRRRRRL